jgi:tRNA 2-thiocytidine biosynthesis protein TtcA
MSFSKIRSFFEILSISVFYFSKSFGNRSFRVILSPFLGLHKCMGKLTEEDKLMRRIEKRFNKGVVQYGLIEDGDKILVGLSGGKDSLALLELLARRSRIYKPRFSVVAAHVVMTNIAYESDMDYLRAYAEELGVPFVRYETSFDPSTDTRKSPCFLCSWNRRKALFTVAKEQGCNKIALGHHMDDILETLLMNMTFQGAFSTMPPRLVMRKFDMTIIRPMCLVHEADLIEMAQVRGYRKQIKNCPYEKDSHRSDMKEVLRLLERMNPEARYSLWGSMNNIQADLLPASVDE